MLASQMKQKQPQIRRVVKVGGIAVATGLTVAAIWYAAKKAMVAKWMHRMDENDVRVAAYFIGLVGPQNLIAKLKAMILDKAKDVPVIGTAITWIQKGWDYVNGNMSLYDACLMGVHQCDSWSVVQEAYHGLTAGHELHKDLQKKLSADEFQKLMVEVQAHKRSINNGNATISTGRSMLIGVIYKWMAKVPADTIITLGPEQKTYRATKLAGYDDPTKGYKSPHMGQSERFKAKQLIGNPTGRLVRLKKGQVLMEVNSPAGPLWFKPEAVTIWIP